MKFLTAIALFLFSAVLLGMSITMTSAQACPQGPCANGVSNGCNWCASSNAAYYNYIGTCSNGCATFRECGGETKCIEFAQCQAHCA